MAKRHQRRLRVSALLLALLSVGLSAGLIGDRALAHNSTDHAASGFVYWLATDEASCGLSPLTGGFQQRYFLRGHCVRIDFSVSNTPTSEAHTVAVNLVGLDGSALGSFNAVRVAGNNNWRVWIRTLPAWPAGEIAANVVVNGAPAGAGEFYLHGLGATASAIPKSSGTPYAPGEAIPLRGNVHEHVTTTGSTIQNGVPARFSLRVRTPAGELRGPYGPFTAQSNGDFPADLMLPASATAGLSAGAATNFRLDVAVEVIDAAYTDPATGTWAARAAGSSPVALVSQPTTLLLENDFSSSTGWVKPGQSYPFRLLVKNRTSEQKRNVVVTVPAPSGVILVDARAVGNVGAATVESGTLRWEIDEIAEDTTATLVVRARAKTAGQDPRIVWKDLSTTASMTYAGGPTLKAESHGPKVIPPTGGFETARYGDKPFPIIPVDFRDRKHKPARTGDRLARVVNDKDYAGSTFNLYQEMSLGQLFPIGTVPSAGLATAGFEYAPGFSFTERDLRRPTCRGATVGGLQQLFGTPVYPERIRDGWYQLPGDTEYYGGDFPVFTATSIAIDSACGDTGKLVYDAVQIADPEIDYNQYDTDKDGVVDFAMVVFAGCGGNGGSQLSPLLCPEDPVPYDNPWPHSSTLESGYQDPETGLAGYISDDRLTNLEGTPQCWKDDQYNEFASCAANGGTGRNDLPVQVRVGPYNINPEDAIDRASVIAHEYGHYLGLPDFYSNSYSAYNDWNLMASDYSQHMTIFSKQELGWVVPRFLQPGERVDVNDWEEIKNDTKKIEWQTPSGEPYTLAPANGDQNVHNAEAYALKLPAKLVIDPAKVAAGASAPWVQWSGSGNDFGCAPKAGHNLDISLPELEFVAPGTSVTVSFKSSWDIEWDFDYGFVLASSVGDDGRRAYQSLPSQNGYTITKNVNPNSSACLNAFDNGLTGTSGAAAGGPAQVAADRAATSYDSGSPFVADSYDLSSFAGKRGVVLRFSYATDVGLARPGWFVDDLEVKAGDNVVYSSNFSNEEELRVFPGGCRGDLKVAAPCTAGWSRLKADEPSEFDHAYYLELRDRSGFDASGRGQSDRGAIGWAAGVLVEYTDEVRGYGNSGYPTPPRQHYLDSQPTPDFACGGGDLEEHPLPNPLPPQRCRDAAFTAATGDNRFRDVGWIDNFWDDSAPDGLWHFDYGCLTLDVLSMAGAGASEALPSDLTANATIQAGTGCRTFDYWGGSVNAAPTAIASAAPKIVGAGKEVRFDSTGTFDDRTPAEKLTYSWAFGDGTTATGATAMHAYAAKGTYTATLTVTDPQGLSGTATVPIVVLGADLRVTNIVAQNQKGPEGEKVKLTATILNAAPGVAPASKTEFVLDGTTVLGVVDTPSLDDGESAQVSLLWDTRSVKGQHTIHVTADVLKLVAEESEDNNTATRTVSVQGNKVSNGDFEQAGSDGTAPASWSGQSTEAGTATYESSGGNDGSRSVAMTGTGGDALAAGPPMWTSDPIPVTSGEVLELVASVRTVGVSSAPGAALAYLGASGELLETVRLLSAPLTTDAFQTLRETVAIPAGVTQVRVVLLGFAPTDMATAGTVTFDDIALFVK